MNQTGQDRCKRRRRILGIIGLGFLILVIGGVYLKTPNSRGGFGPTQTPPANQPNKPLSSPKAQENHNPLTDPLHPANPNNPYSLTNPNNIYRQMGLIK